MRCMKRDPINEAEAISQARRVSPLVMGLSAA